MRLWFAPHPNAVVANSLLSLGGFLGAGALGYFFQLILTRRLSVEQYGEFQSLISLSALLGVASVALLTFVVAHTAVFASAGDTLATRLFLRSLERRAALAAVVLFPVLLFFNPLVRKLLHLSDSAGFPVVAALALLSLLVVLPQGTLMGWQAFLPLNVVLVAGALVKLAVGIPLVVLLPRASAAAGALLLSAVSNRLLLLRQRKRLLESAAPLASSATDWRARYFPRSSARREVTYVTLFAAMLALVQNLDVLLVKHFGPEALAGHYSGLVLVGRLVLWSSTSVVNAILPVASARSHAGEPLGWRVRSAAYALLALLAGAALLPAVVSPGLLLHVLLGPAYVTDMRVAWLFAVQGALSALLLFEANVSYARRDRSLLVLLGATAGLLTLGVFLSHGSVEAVVRAVIAAVGTGYVGILLRNLLASPRPLALPRAPAPTPGLA